MLHTNTGISALAAVMLRVDLDRFARSLAVVLCDGTRVPCGCRMRMRDVEVLDGGPFGSTRGAFVFDDERMTYSERVGAAGFVIFWISFASLRETVLLAFP